LPPAEKVRAHYFASDRGTLKDSREKSDSADDAAAYNLIMKDKEALISLENPVRFIFSHSALAEGWDNPNVFTICNLQETQSVMKRRQQIGRGLRLPVMANGERCRVDELNVVTVIASETFEKYADGLQREIAEDTGETVVGMVKNERQRPTLVPKTEVLDSPIFKELWRRIAPKSRFRLDFDSQDVIDEAVTRLTIDKKSFPDIVLPKIRVQRGRLRMEQVDVEGKRALDLSVKSEVSAVEMEFNRPVPFTDILKDLSTELAVSRNTIYEVIMKSGRLEEGRNNPAVFRKYISKAIQQALSRVLVDKQGIRYTPILAGEDRVWSADFFAEVQAYKDTLVPVTKSIYDQIPCDSDVEKRYAAALEEREDIEFFLKLPSWFKVSTPVGGYNPDWAIVRQNQKGEPEYLYLVRETKGTTVISNLRFESEGWKIHFGREHFKAIQIDYKVNKEAYDLDLETPMTFDDDLDSDDRT
jgi:type III restriction enzyme